MTMELALNIANEFLDTMNPDMQDGNGDEPSGLNQSIWSKRLTDDVSLDISFEYDNEDGWCTVCELVDVESNEMFEIMSSYGIDSPQNIADTIYVLTEMLF